MKSALLGVLLSLLLLGNVSSAEKHLEFLPPLLPSLSKHYVLVGYRHANTGEPFKFFLVPFPWACSAAILKDSLLLCLDYPAPYVSSAL